MARVEVGWVEVPGVGGGGTQTGACRRVVHLHLLHSLAGDPYRSCRWRKHQHLMQQCVDMQLRDDTHSPIVSHTVTT